MKETKTACPLVVMVRFWDPNKQLCLSYGDFRFDSITETT